METNDAPSLGQFDLELLHRVAHSKNAIDLQNVAAAFCDAFEFSRWIYGVAGPDVVLTNYPTDWIAAYVSNRWHRGTDPVIDAITERRRAVHWDTRRSQPLGKPLDPIQKRIFADRWHVGARHGVTAPVFDGASRPFDFGVLSFSRETPLTEIEQRHHEPRVQIFATYFHSVAPALLRLRNDNQGTNGVVPKLTCREYDCLNWAAKGKSNWEISRLLSVSGPTVEFHLANASRKLTVRGKIAAIAKATRLKLVDPI